MYKVYKEDNSNLIEVLNTDTNYGIYISISDVKQGFDVINENIFH